MRFYVELKWPEYGGYKGCTFEELEILIKAHKRYRSWLDESDDDPSLPYPTEITKWLDSITRIYLPMNSMWEILASSDDEEEKDRARSRAQLPEKASVTPLHLYPGLEDRDYSSSEGSAGRIEDADSSVDLEEILNSPYFPSDDDMEKLFPLIKYVGGYIDLPINMSPEEILKEENSSDPWSLLSRSVECTIAGIRLYGMNSFYLEN